jgi:hypothetical protein
MPFGRYYRSVPSCDRPADWPSNPFRSLGVQRCVIRLAHQNVTDRAWPELEDSSLVTTVVEPAKEGNQG